MSSSRLAYKTPDQSDLYIMHGSNRPPLEKLASYDKAFDASGHPYVSLIHAEVLLDLTVSNPETSQKSIQRASDRLDEMLDDATALVDAGSSYARRHAGTYVSACLRHAELPNWSQAAQGKGIVMDYDSMLDGANRAVEFAYPKENEGPLAEFIPLLLFARAQRIHHAQQSVGRLSLQREDRGYFPEAHMNPSWDIGVSSDNSPHTFKDPTDRIQIKQGKNGGTAQPYHNAGVMFLRGTVYGFSDPVSIVDSCLIEAGENMPHVTTPLSSGELDALTENIMLGIEKEKSILSEAA